MIFRVKLFSIAAMVLGLMIAVAPCNPLAAHPLSQGRIEITIHTDRIVLHVYVPAEEVIVEQSISSGDDDNFTLSTDAYRKHGAYFLRHFTLIADGKVLDEKLIRVDEQDVRSVHVLDVGHVGAMYELEFPTTRIPDSLALFQNVLNEFEYAPGNRWEVSYIVRAERDGEAIFENRLLGSGSALTFDCQRTRSTESTSQSVKPSASLPVPSKSAPTLTPLSHRLAGALLGFSVIYFAIALLRRRRA